MLVLSYEVGPEIIAYGLGQEEIVVFGFDT